MSFILNFSFWMCSRLHANDCKRGRNAIKIPVLSQSTVVRPSSAPFSFSLHAGGLACGRACTRKVYRPSTNWYSAVHLRFGNILSVFIATNPEGPDLFDASAVYISPINIPSIGTTPVNYRHPRYNRHHYPFVQLLFHATAGNYVVGTARQLKKISFWKRI